MWSRKTLWKSVTGGLIVCAVACGVFRVNGPGDEVTASLGEPYEQVRKQSRSTLPPIEMGAFWAGYVSRPAKFRFSDPQYGFVTPAAKFLTVGYDEYGKVWSVKLSPQTKTLPLDKTMEIVLDLQNQLRRQGWRPILEYEHPAVSNTPEMITRIQRGDDPHTYWQVAGKYQLTVDIRRFTHESRPEDQRFLITLALSDILTNDYLADVN